MKYHFSFKPDYPIREIEDDLMLAMLAVENIYGRSALRLDVNFLLDRKGRTCEINADNETSQAVARVFTGFLSRQFGEEAFRVDRIVGQVFTRKKPGFGRDFEQTKI